MLTSAPETLTVDGNLKAEARYRGQKVVVVSPDYADNTKFADEWLPAHPGTDAALAMSMGHVILKEFFVEKNTPYFTDYVKKYTDLPFLVSLTERDGRLVPGKFLTAADLGGEHADTEAAVSKPVLLDADGTPVVPNGSLGHRFTASGEGRWNLDLQGVDPLLTLHGGANDAATVALPRFDTDQPGVLERGVPTRIVAGHRVTTVFDLMLAQYGVARDGLPGTWPTGYDDAAEPYTPAWQESITGVPAQAAERIAREFADNAERSKGRSMILMGAGTNHWFHSDQIYRSFLSLVMLTGCQGVNGGGWAHYVGQEKCRPVTGWGTLAFGLDWQRAPRQMQGTVFWYLATDQWRYDRFTTEPMTSPLATGTLAGRTAADNIALASRLGWMPSYPTFNRNPLDLADEAERQGKDAAQHVLDGLKSGHLQFACEDPDAPENFPRCLTVWRSNLLGSSAKGNEYFLKHLLGADSNVAASDEDGVRPQEVRWRDQAPAGKLDLLLSLDFRNTSTTLYSDIVLPAATWYEKHDLSSTDMHPFVHAFSPAISPPWETKTDFDAFHRIARGFSWLAEKHLGKRKDIVAMPLAHDSSDATAQPGGKVLDWRAGECEPIPGKTMPRLVTVERDYPALADKMAALGPLVETLGLTVKGVTTHPDAEVDYLRGVNGVSDRGVAAGRPSLAKDTHAAEAILALSGTTNGRLAVEGFEALQRRTGTELVDLAAEAGGLGVGVEGDALDRVGVLVDGEVAVEHRPQAVALDREDQHVGLAVLEDVVDERVVGQPEHLGGVVGGGGAGRRVFLGAALVEALGLDGLVLLAGLELDDLGADVLGEQALHLVGADLLAGLHEAGDQEDLLLLVEDLVLGLSRSEGHGGPGDADAAEDAHGDGEADGVASTIACHRAHSSA